MVKAGITGGIGAGKTLVSKIFHALGIPIYDADSKAKWLMANNLDLVSRIKKLLGNEAYTSQNLPDTKYIAASVFGNEHLLQELNSLVHPAVGNDFDTWAAMQKDVPFVLKEAALLFESGSYKTLDFLITVSAPIEVRLERIAKRDPFRTREQVLAIISKQLPQEEKILKSDFVVQNDGLTLVIPQVLKIFSELSKH